MVSTYMEKIVDVESRELRLSLKTLRDITNDFSRDQVIGQGRFGTVYKGVSGDGKAIAVRKLYPVREIDDEQFQNEVAFLMNIKHRNIVRLVGYCNEKEEVLLPYNGRHVFASKIDRMLCFEYIQNGSLDCHISDISFGLDWNMRYRIIQGICEGLKYLHEELPSPMLHLDLKPSNILLDQNMTPKICDFGISRLLVEENVRHKPLGTIGYMPPEFIERQVTSSKFDIFSLGVIIMKVVAGSSTGSNDVEWVLEKWRERLQKTENVMSVERDHRQVGKCIEIALKCVECDRHKRPSIGEIVNGLNKIETVIPEEIRAVQNRFDSRKSLILDVYPRELYFSFMLKGRKKDIASCLLQLKNRGDDRAAFMLVSNIPESYLLNKPLYGVVPPRSTCTLTLTKLKQTTPTPSDSSDFFTLYITVVGQFDLLDVQNDYTHYSNYFKTSTEYGDKVQLVKLKVICDRPAAKSTETSPEVIFVYRLIEMKPEPYSLPINYFISAYMALLPK